VRPRLITALALAALFAAQAPVLAAQSVGGRDQIAGVRRAAGNIVAAELAGNGAGVCAILRAPLRTTEHHRTCAQRWDSKLTVLLREPGGRARLKAQRHAIPAAVVTVHGASALIDLPTPLLNGASRFLWTEDCWMLTG
jgi:hypothetical protein